MAHKTHFMIGFISTIYIMGIKKITAKCSFILFKIQKLKGKTALACPFFENLLHCI